MGETNYSAEYRNCRGIDQNRLFVDKDSRCQWLAQCSVHPDDASAEWSMKRELGKLNAGTLLLLMKAEIIYGYHAQSVKNCAKWSKPKNGTILLARVPVKAGDFFLCAKWYHGHRFGHSILKPSTVINDVSSFTTWSQRWSWNLLSCTLNSPLMCWT